MHVRSIEEHRLWAHYLRERNEEHVAHTVPLPGLHAIKLLQEATIT